MLIESEPEQNSLSLSSVCHVCSSRFRTLNVVNNFIPEML
ncbi:hypothetical protein AB93_4486 [Escherichia coli 5-172-05_S3_C1]|nr:hypothetical protein AD45_4360 [Escherichia coli 4-203-08_S4_C3]KEL05918.1 hypothetical protein AD19_4476 [Escherichia coli 4-203-08_S4_C2]KEL10072.1 hypothetical protein AC08_4500 [Escherichia coli 4-203-08_S3_C1]KEL47201.1 hypothetical protein AB93_4486 [Escherichia coli 5-172-05_S3_C1]